MALNDELRNGERDPALDRLYRAGAADEPPARLDAAILAAARREVGARPVSVSSGLRRWRVPVSLAAVVVLSVSLVTLVREEGGDSLRQSPPEAAAPAAAPAQPAQPAPGAPAENRAARSRAADSAAARKDTSAGESVGKAAESSLASTSGPAATQGTTAGAAATGVAPELSAKPSSQPFRDAPPSMAEPNVPATPSSRASADQVARAPAAAERRAAPMPGPDASGAKATAQARKESAAEDRQAPVWQGYEKEPPQKWLDRIQELRRQQRIVDADAMLAEFRRRFPEHPLPAGQP